MSYNCWYSIWSADYETWTLRLVAIRWRGSAEQDSDGLSANSAQCGFEVIKNSINKKGEKSISKGDIIVATVKGDVHDIGKNIAKVILENYGYNVIDLGKDVEIEEIVKVSTERNIQIPNVKVMVGGAVLTKEYSKEIDADFYLKDAKVNVEVAKKVLKNE